MLAHIITDINKPEGCARLDNQNTIQIPILINKSTFPLLYEFRHIQPVH